MPRPVAEGSAREVYLVFSQRDDTRPDGATWDAQARRFFGASLTVRLGESEALSDGGARIAVTPEGAPQAERNVRARRATDADYALARDAEVRMSGGGLGSLARRCPVVWEVEREADSDPDALRVAAVLASVLLGPIVDARGPDIFGVKTAREKLSRAESAVRRRDR
jgi:hypothetical protein